MNLFTGTEGLVWWQGIVEDVNDPETLGRVRVRIFGFHSDDKSKIPTDKLPWAAPIMPITSAAIGGVGQSPTGSLPGAWVMGFFRDGMNAQDPIVWGTVYGKPNATSIKSPDGSYPAEGSAAVEGGTVVNQSDVNPLATGAGVETSESAASASNDNHNKGNDSASPDQSGTPNDADNRKRLSKITTKNGKSTWVATIYAKNFQNFINEFERTPAPNHPDGYTIYSLGGYVHRQSRGSKKWSYHASGVAIDINPAENPYQKTFESDMPANTSAIAKKYGLGWGGDWNSVKDAMHFSMAKGERGTVPIKRNGIVPDPETGSQDSKSIGSSVEGTPLEYSSSTSAPTGNTGTYDKPEPKSSENIGAAPSLDVSEWKNGTDYSEGDLVRSPQLQENQIGSLPPYTFRTGIITAAAAMQCSALDFGTVMSYEMGGRWDARRMGPETEAWGQHRGVIQFGEPQAKKYGVDFSTEQTAIDTQLGPNGAVVKFLRDHGVKNGMGRLEIYSAINAGGVGEKYYGRSDAAAGGAKGTVRDKVNNQMGGHEANARRLLNSKDDGKYIEQKVYRAVKSGTSSDSGTGPASSKLKDGDVMWEVAPEEFQSASRNTQNAMYESEAPSSSDGYSVAPQQSGGGSSSPKPPSVEKKIADTDVTDLFQEPDNPFAAKYPHNKALFTESGHIQEFDDTPGAERIHTYHRTGTFEEIHPDGTRVVKVVKDNYEIIFGENNIHVKGTANVVVDADVNVKIGGNVNVEVGGKIDTTSGGNTTIKGAQIHLNP